MLILPLTNNPEESFNITISGTVYNIRQLWNTLGFWTIDILDENGDPLAYGVKLVTKTELTFQHPSVPFNLRSDADEDPSRDSLDSFNLVVTDKDV